MIKLTKDGDNSQVKKNNSKNVPGNFKGTDRRSGFANFIVKQNQSFGKSNKLNTVRQKKGS